MREFNHPVPIRRSIQQPSRRHDYGFAAPRHGPEYLSIVMFSVVTYRPCIGVPCLRLSFPPLLGARLHRVVPRQISIRSAGGTFSFDCDPNRSVRTVSFDRGNRVTAENTGRLTVVTPDADETKTVWVDRDSSTATSEFPLAPGATLTHEIPGPATTRLVWVAPERNTSRAVAVWRSETATSEADR